ncbi:MAG: response regulator transcription factor [Phaeodactylibacter sp.]|nr:response regulator transcription factor [Phaeodactylibacter sp.]MCB9272640.1 response regulator transcription factor [Lewinellaceae bacterium]
MYSVAIIDDQASSRKVLKNLLAQLCPDVEVVGEADGVATGVSLIRSKRPDAIFLDIQMEDGMGFDLIKFFPVPEFSIIFTSGYNNYATEAFRVNAIDYLLKPINPEDLVKAVEKLNFRDTEWNHRLASLVENLRPQEEKKLRLPTTKGWTFWRPEDIVRLEASDNMTFFYNNKGDRILVAKNISANQELLPPARFFRCHKSHIVNRDYIKEVLREDGGSALLEDGVTIPISRRRMANFLEWLRGNSL